MLHIQLVEMDRRYEQRFMAQQEAIAAALKASERTWFIATAVITIAITVLGIILTIRS